MSNTSIPASGEVRWSAIRDVFGGSNPVKMAHYYTNHAAGYTSGISGLPTSGNPFQISTFRGKQKGFSAANIPTFTNCGATGYAGPTAAQMQATYGSAWSNLITMGSYQGYQVLTVPESGTYKITCWGAIGGYTANGHSAGGGAIIEGTFSLTSGQKVIVIVGQAGPNYANGDPNDTNNGRYCVGGGGGGTFVVDAASSNVPMICAGGGGAGGNSTAGGSSTIVTLPPTASSTNGTGGGFSSTASGAGIFSNGFLGSRDQGWGGFGGGGAGTSIFGTANGGGAGGYIGGGITRWGVNQTQGFGGGAGTSYVNTAICSSYSNLGTWGGHGKVTIVKI